MSAAVRRAEDKVDSATGCAGHGGRGTTAVADFLRSSAFGDISDLGYLSVEDIHILPGSFAGNTYRISSGRRDLIVKQRSDRRTLFVTRAVTQLMARSSYPVQSIVLPLAEMRGNWFLGLGWLDGAVLSRTTVNSLPVDDRRQIGSDLISWIRTLHRFTAPRWDWGAHAHARFNRKREQALRFGALSSAEADTVSRTWEQLRPTLAGVRACLTHRDLHPANILLRGSGFLTVIDFENVRIADPLYDLVKVQDFVLTLDPEVAAGIVSALRIHTWDERQWGRFRSVCTLEYLSSVVYHTKRGEVRKAGERLASLLRTCEDTTCGALPLRVVG